MSDFKVKKDCFAYRESEPNDLGVVHESCNALTDLYCTKEKCRFYKSYKKKFLEAQKVEERLEKIRTNKEEE